MISSFTKALFAAGFAITATAGYAQATSATDYMTQAGASDLYEINSSQIVLQSTQDPKITRFANEMIKDHQKTTQVLTMAAQKAGMTPPPPALDAPKTDMINQLYAVNGTQRDQLYLQQQAQAHQQALALHSGYAQDGDTPQLKAAAKKAVPIIKMHIKMLDGMNKSGGSNGGM